ncbi:MAG: inositol monophosphatase family protein [Deltaproteobacteria bacterium]
MDRTDLALARELAARAAEVALRYFRRPLNVRFKPDGTKVTDADLAVEACLLDTLARDRPDDAVLSEERGQIGNADRTWILDPIDGTSIFAEGHPRHWGTHIALQVGEQVVLGVITRPVTGDCWWATKGGGAHRGSLQPSTSDQLLRVSKTPHFRESTVAFWAETADARRRRDLLQAKANLVEATMDCILEVAAGELDLAICDASCPWDLAPGVILVEEAGGRFTDPVGGRRLDTGEGWYSNSLVHDAAQAATR